MKLFLNRIKKWFNKIKNARKTKEVLPMTAPTQQEQYAELFEELESTLEEALAEILEMKQRQTKVGAKRIRKLTLTLGNLGKEYRKLSVAVVG